MTASRRAFLGCGMLVAVSTGLGRPPARPGAQRREFVLWGSSSAASVKAGEHPPGHHPARIEGVLSRLLGVPGTTRGVGGDVSSQTLSMRCYDHPYKPDFASLGAPVRLPAGESVVVATVDGRVPGRCGPIPGTVAGTPCSIRMVEGRPGTVAVRLETDGGELEVGAGRAGWWHTGLEELHRGQVHLLWMGKNNIEDSARVVRDTRAAYAVAPDATVVMGHWHTHTDRRGTDGWRRVRRVNAAYREEFGARYHDTMADLRDPALWRLPALRPYRIGASAEDRQWLAMGLPPRSVVGNDLRHLNALGNTIVAYGLHRFLTGTAELY